MSTKFKTGEHEWDCSVTVGTLHDIRDSLDINLLELLDNGAALMARLHGDMFLLVDCIWMTVKRQHDVEASEFARGLGGDKLDEAANAWFEGLINFFRKPEQREAIREVLRKAENLTAAVIKQGVTELESIDVELEAKKLIESFGGKPVKSDLASARSEN